MTRTLVPLELPPGFFRQGTAFQGQGRWIDGNLIRFSGSVGTTVVRPVGGWVPFSGSSAPVELTGPGRGVLGWEVTGGRGFVAFGSINSAAGTEQLWVYNEGTLYDITPVALQPGRIDTLFGQGTTGAYGEGAYGAGPYGVASTGFSAVDPADVWHLDTFGDWLVGSMTPSNPGIYLFDDLNTFSPATPVTDRTSGQPIVASKGTFVTNERFLVALGADNDVRAVKWASRETVDDWTPVFENSAGDFRLAGVGEIMAARRSKTENLIWTDQALWNMNFLGGQFIYGFTKLAANCGAISPWAMTAFQRGFAWMGQHQFFIYDGRVRELPSEVGDYVFDDFNQGQSIKVAAFTNATFSEVWWLYPSQGALEPDRYVVWNYAENHWAFGMLDRSAGSNTTSTFITPFMVGPPGSGNKSPVYQHETGWDHDGVRPFASSGPTNIGTGDRQMQIHEIVPDSELGKGPLSPDADLVEAFFLLRDYPTSPFELIGPISLTEYTPTRFAARQVSVSLQEVAAGDWRVGMFRFNATPGGGRR